MSVKDILIVSATTTTIGQFLSGMFTVRKILRMGTAGDLSPIPFLSAVVGCSLWLLYGLIIEDNTIVYTNVVGVTLNGLYVIFFLRFITKPMILVREAVGAFLFLAFVYVYIGSLPEQLEQKNTLGLVCVVITLLCCASPLIALKLVIESKSTETLPFPLILSMFLVGTQWWLYGVLIQDFYMQVTNFLATIIAILQLSLFVVYPASPKKKSQSSSQTYVPLVNTSS